jgi:O-methyltransferase
MTTPPIPIRLMHGLERVAGYIRNPKGEFNCDFQADGLAVKNKNLDWMREPKFVAAYEAARVANIAGWKRFTGGSVPDIRWRAHTCCWAALQAMKLPGDFAEFGVHTGILSMTVCHYTDFAKADKTFFLFDTFNGIPEEQVVSEDLEKVRHHNEKLFFDCYDLAVANFAPFPNAELVRGILPDTLTNSGLGPLAYVSIDLNNTVAERAVIDAIWDRIVPGGIIILDDYGFVGYESQHAMWNEFAAGKSHPILSMPTGQGVLIKR